LYACDIVSYFRILLGSVVLEFWPCFTVNFGVWCFVVADNIGR
jgi:hypothetical protein